MDRYILLCALHSFVNRLIFQSQHNTLWYCRQFEGIIILNWRLLAFKIRTVFGFIYEIRFLAIWHLFFWKITNDKRLSLQFSFRLDIGDALNWFCRPSACCGLHFRMSFSPNQSTGSLSTTYIIIYSVINTQENLCSLENKTVGLPLCREHQSDGDLKFYIRTLRSSTALWYLFLFNNNICWIIGRRQTGILVD